MGGKTVGKKATRVRIRKDLKNVTETSHCQFLLPHSINTSLENSVPLFQELRPWKATPEMEKQHQSRPRKNVLWTRICWKTGGVEEECSQSRPTLGCRAILYVCNNGSLT